MLPHLLLLAALPAGAADLIYQDTIQGGISVDGSGVSTPYDGSSSWYSGDSLLVQIPTTATITDVFLILHGKWSGFLGDPDTEVRVNGVDLDSAVLLESASRYRVTASSSVR